MLADDRNEFAHSAFVNRDGRHFFILPPSRRNIASSHTACFSVGSRSGKLMRAAMSFTNVRSQVAAKASLLALAKERDRQPVVRSV